MKRPVVWTKEADDLLMELISEERSISSIASEMGLSRDAINGRFRRLCRRGGRQYA